MALSPETQRILRILISYWEGAAKSERDIDEIEAFTKPAWQLHQALEGNHEDVRKVIPKCPIYPKWGHATLQELADAERDGGRIVVTEKDGGISWEVK